MLEKDFPNRGKSEHRFTWSMGASFVLTWRRSTLDRRYSDCTKPKMACVTVQKKKKCLRNSQEGDHGKDFG